MTKKKTVICIWLALALVCLLAGCGKAYVNASYTQTLSKGYFDWFDTVTYIQSFAGDSQKTFDENCSALAQQIEKYHRLFDIYHEYEGMNNLCTVNKMAGISPVQVAAEIIEFLDYCVSLYELTDGELNVMMGSVLSLWHNARQSATGDGPDGPVSLFIPSEEELLQASAHMDIGLLQIDRKNSTVYITDPRASLDVGAVAKGFAAEKCAAMLALRGVSGYVVNIGGNLRLVGAKADGSAWTTGIKDPFDRNSLAVRIRIEDTSCVTSGVYERFFSFNGRRYHHIIDRDTLSPATGYSSVSVVTHDGALADALSTALFCMDRDGALSLLEKLRREGKEVEVLFITEDGERICTEGFEKLLVQ